MITAAAFTIKNAIFQAKTRASVPLVSLSTKSPSSTISTSTISLPSVNRSRTRRWPRMMEMEMETATKGTIICREMKMITMAILPKKLVAPVINNSLIKRVMKTLMMLKRKKKLRSKQTMRKIMSKKKRMMVLV